MALENQRRGARRFLQGLSNDELRYIASYFGACLLESAFHSKPASREEIAGYIVHYEHCRALQAAASAMGGCGASTGISVDMEHKMILLLEYLSSCRCAAAFKVAAGSA